MKWIQREFPTDVPLWMAHNIIERLRGTPARLEDRLSAVGPRALAHRVEDRWSILENLGHLIELEPLWYARVEELAQGATELTAADMTNQATNAGAYNSQNLSELLSKFRLCREALIRALDDFPAEALGNRALHSRLKQPMTVVDHLVFVAEHDDHHLATISSLLKDTAE